MPHPFLDAGRWFISVRERVGDKIRIHGQGDWHYITCSCYRRQPFLGTAGRRDWFLEILEEVRQKYGFIIGGYVVMPEHFHLLVSEPKVGTPSVVIQVLKQRVSRTCRASAKETPLPESDVPRAFWQTRYYDFNVGTRKKYLEKLNYIHFNPVKRGLVKSPEEWRWSSCRFYWLGEQGAVKVGE